MTNPTATARSAKLDRLAGQLATDGMPASYVVSHEVGGQLIEVLHVYTVEPDRVVRMIELASERQLVVDLVAPSMYRLA